MGFNYSAEKAKFDREHRKMHDEYIAAGMTEETWQELYKFDYDQFNCDRKEARYTVPLDVHNDDIEEKDDSNNPLFADCLEYLSVTINDEPSENRFWWIEELDDPELARLCRTLSEDEKEIITEFVFENKTQKGIAESMNTYQKNVSRIIGRVKRKIRKTN